MHSRETNRGNPVGNVLLWYGQRLHKDNLSLATVCSTDVDFVNGGGLRNMIGTEQVMPNETVHRSPPESNPRLNKQAGEISRLDVLNSLRFDTSSSTGKISVAQLKRSAVAMVGETRHGWFVQDCGFRFHDDPSRPRIKRVINMGLARLKLLSDGRIDARSQQREPLRPLVGDGKPRNPQLTLGLATITDLAEGGDGQAAARLSQHLDNELWIGVADNPTFWRSPERPQRSVLGLDQDSRAISAGVLRRQLGFGSYRDALGVYLEANHGGGRPAHPLTAADQLSNPNVRPARIVRIDARVSAAQKP